jgi:urease accessory protein
MRARCRIHCEDDGQGSTRVFVADEPPVALRITPFGLYVVSSAYFPLGGDHLRIDITVGPDSCLVVRSVASSVVRPRAGRSETVITAEVGPNAGLYWLTEPTVSASGSQHRQVLEVGLHETARLSWRDEVVLGDGSNSSSGAFYSRVRVSDGCGPILHQEFSFGDSTALHRAPTHLSTYRFVGSWLTVGLNPSPVPDHPASRPQTMAGRLALARPGSYLGVALSHSMAGLRRAWVDVMPHAEVPLETRWTPPGWPSA